MQTTCLFTLLAMVEGIISVTVITQPEINATLGMNSSIVLNCTITKETTIGLISMIWRKKIGDSYIELAEFKHFPSRKLRFTDNGSYLINRSELVSYENGSTSFILMINDTECHDDGNYQCLISRVVDELIKITNDTAVFLQVDAERPTNFTLYPNNILRENDTVVLSCSANVGNSEGYIAIWKTHKQENVPNLLNKSSSVVEKAENCTTIIHLTITYIVSRNDNGTIFSCSSQNRQTQTPGPSRFTDIIQVLYGPSDVKINISPSNTTLIIGGNVVLRCNSDGNPIPTFKWIFNSTYDQNDEKRWRTTDWKSRTLVLKNINVNNSGVYTCVASNSIYGETLNKSSDITLKVQKQEHVTEYKSTCGGNRCAFTQSCKVQDYKAVCTTNIWSYIALTFILLTLIFVVTTAVTAARICVRRTKTKDKTSINGNVKLGDRVQSQSNDYDISGYSDPKDVTKLCPNTEKSGPDNTAYADPVDSNNQYASVQKTTKTSDPPNVYDGAWV